MSIFHSFSSIIFFILTVVFVKISGNDKAPFLMIMPIIYSLVLSIIYFITIIKGYKVGLDKKIYFDFFLAILPIAYTFLIILLARKGIVDSMLFLGFR